ncbi:MAG: helix-turn-helix domain-containing protein [Paludibacteraceae bacterium]|nr:helix-turn-helix domain-containing protein [Paludibacteraceae bacterium]
MKKLYLLKKKRETDANERTKIGEILRTRRHLKNLTQEEVAKLIGLTTTAYSKIERGESGVNMDRLRQLGKVLEVDLDTLIDNAPPSRIALQDLISNLKSMNRNIEKISSWIASEKPQIYRIADAGTVMAQQDFEMLKAGVGQPVKRRCVKQEKPKKRVYKKKKPNKDKEV